MNITLASFPAADSDATGELAPFEDVYRAQAGSVHRFCLSQVGNHALAEDLTHETFLRAYAAYGRVRPDVATVRTWLVAIARNVSTDYQRRRGRWLRLVPRLHAGDAPAAQDIENVAEHRAELERVMRALTHLRMRDRQLIGLRVAADLTHREIAGLLGISESVAKVATFRALTRLRARLEDAP